MWLMVTSDLEKHVIIIIIQLIANTLQWGSLVNMK